jgi:hypothetical protein
MVDDTAGFVLYYRENCHLCESMRFALARLQRSFDSLRWQEVDIDRDTDLIRRFDVLVPVLYHADSEVCHHFIDEDAVRSLLPSP